MVHPPFHMVFVQDRYGIESVMYTNQWGVPRLARIDEAREMAESLGRRLLYFVRVTPKDRAR